jgi:hypothetical protein
MHMNNQHVIEKAVFDISFGSEEEAFEQHVSLGTFVRDRLMAVVAEVFDELSPDGQVLRIDGLEVDLGDVPYHGYPEEMENRLRERLRAALREKLMIPGEKQAAGEGVVTRDISEMEQLTHFLTKGRMPWYAQPGKDVTIDQMLRRVLRSKGREFAEFLKGSSRREKVIKRLAAQFSDEILTDILHELVPSRSSFLADIVDYFRRTLRKHTFTAASERELTRFIWEELINELLKTEGTSYDTTDLVSRIVNKISLHQGRSYQWMLTILASEAVNAEKRQGQGRELADIFEKLIAKEEKETEKEKPSGVELLRERLADAMVRGDAEGIKDIWPVFLRDNPEVLKDAIRHYGTQVTVLRKMGSGFPEPILRDIVHLIEPAESGFINEIVEQAELFRQARGEPAEGVGGTKRKLREFTLSYLLVERAGRFNKRTYLGSMTRQMAAHDNVRYTDLLASLTGAMERVGAPGGLKSEMLQLLGELAEEAGRRRQAAGDGNAQSDESTRADELHGRIKKALPHKDTKRAGVEAGLKRIFHELGRENPRVLLLLYRRLSIEALRRLISAFLTMTQQADGNVISDFIGALESYADRAGNRKGYYWQVFERLVRNEVIDFELIAGVDISPDEDGKMDNAPRGVEDQRVDPETRWVPKAGPARKELTGEAEKELSEYLNEDRPMSASEAARLTRSIDLMMSRRPDRLRRLLEEFLEKGGLVGKIIDLLPGSLMTRVLCLLQLPDAEMPRTDPVAQKIELPDIARGLEEDDDAFTEEIYIENAGLVLAAPYLPRLFAMLELTEESAFKNRQAAERAVHLLQFMVNESINSPEYQLVLNKILCGVRTGIPIAREIDISDREKASIEGLIRGMIENWKIIGNTSVQGFRESFLQREGRLGLKDDTWHLLVEQRAFDMLLDQIPWSFSIIKHPWMERVVHVTWR